MKPHFNKNLQESTGWSNNFHLGCCEQQTPPPQPLGQGINIQMTVVTGNPSSNEGAGRCGGGASFPMDPLDTEQHWVMRKSELNGQGILG